MLTHLKITFRALFEVVQYIIPATRIKCLIPKNKPPTLKLLDLEPKQNVDVELEFD